jgi:hypothetical protein
MSTAQLDPEQRRPSLARMSREVFDVMESGWA